MAHCNHNSLIKRNRVLHTFKALSTGSLLLIAYILLPTHARAGDSITTNSSDFSAINISTTHELYSLTANQATLSDVLHELGKTADFKLKTFEEMSNVQQDWNFHSMPLSRLLTNLLRGYSTVMLYEETQAVPKLSGKLKLKELWLITQEENADLDEPSTIKIEIQLEQAETLTDKQQQLTAEQQYEITSIDNLEGMTGDDVIATLEQTLVTDKDPLIRKRAVLALSDIGGTRVLDALESGMGDRSGDVRTELAKSFGGIKHQRSMLALGQLLMGDHDASVRQEAVRSLYKQNSPAAHTFIEAALKDKDGDVKKAASEILQQWQLTLDDYLVE